MNGLWWDGCNKLLQMWLLTHVLGVWLNSLYSVVLPAENEYSEPAGNRFAVRMGWLVLPKRCMWYKCKGNKRLLKLSPLSPLPNWTILANGAESQPEHWTRCCLFRNKVPEKHPRPCNAIKCRLCPVLDSPFPCLHEFVKANEVYIIMPSHVLYHHELPASQTLATITWNNLTQSWGETGESVPV